MEQRSSSAWRLKGELVWVSDWAHVMSGWALLCRLEELVNLVLNGELVWMSDWAHVMSGWALLAMSR